MVASIKRSDKLKDEFLANTSHELRTPLTGIMGIVESIMDDPTVKLSAKTRSDLSHVMSSGKRLSHLVNDMIDITQLKNQEIVLQRKPVDMHGLTDVVLIFTQSIVGGKELDVINSISEDTPHVDGDENRLQQIMYNLVGNAIKFTESGQVEISAEKKDDLLEITVSDTGIGIPKDKFETIFQYLEQVDASVVR